MLESPLRTRDAEQMMLSTPSKDRIITSPSIGDEENQENGLNQHPERRLSKRPKVGTPIKMTSLEVRPDNRSRPSVDNNEYGSDCGTEASSSVSARKEWLKQFEKAHENPFHNLKSKKTVTQSTPPRTAVKSLPPRSAMSATKYPQSARAPARMSGVSAASTLVNRLVSEPTKKHSSPIRFKPKLQKVEIQASNDGHASVASLSQWLANDPTSTKKKRHVRKGRNVISKSRQFEKDMENVIIVENNISRGSVVNQKKWLQGAFHGDGDDDLSNLRKTNLATRYAKSEAGGFDAASSISVSNKKDWLKKAFKNASSNESSNDTAEDESRSEIITDDAASSLSVCDKKDWLKKAFTPKKQGFSSGYSKARTDIMDCRGESRDEVAARAKRKFLERRAERTGFATPSKVSQGTVRTPQNTRGTPSKSSQGAVRTPQSTRGAHQDMNGPRVQPEESEIKNESRSKSDEAEERTGPPSGSIVEPTYQVDEDTAPVDFRAARKLLVQRGRDNGNSMRVLNKVDLRKNKFEKMEKEANRRSGAFGLLKPSWDQADHTEGPSDAYEKKYVEDIAPRKSFEELP